MQAEFKELFETLSEITKRYVDVQNEMYNFLEEENNLDETKYYKELDKHMETLKVYENASKIIREEIGKKIKENYNNSDAKYKDDKRKLVSIQLEKEQIKLSKLKY